MGPELDMDVLAVDVEAFCAGLEPIDPSVFSSPIASNAKSEGV